SMQRHRFATLPPYPQLYRSPPPQPDESPAGRPGARGTAGPAREARSAPDRAPARERPRPAERSVVEPAPDDRPEGDDARDLDDRDRKSTRLNSSHVKISYAV